PILVAQAATPTPNPFPTNTPFATPTPFGATPSPAPSPTFGTFPNTTTTLYATPRPQTTPVTPPPVPTATPPFYDPNAPVFVQRGSESPPPITPAGGLPPTPSPTPSGVPTLPPNNVAILADKVSGNTNQGQPGDASGNVHILYGQEEIVGDRAHYDGIRTVVVTGHPFIINHSRDSVLLADAITFDTIDQTAKLTNGRGTSAQGVERGLVHFNANDLHTDADGVGHGKAPLVTTCENSRGGYHMTGRNMDVYPGDKIVIYKAILWLGAAAVFFLPKVVIPLRTLDSQQQQTKYFPDIGYDQYEGFWIKTRVTFGRDQYYYGYYRAEYFTKVGLGLGYVGFYQKKNGRRTANADIYGIHDRRSQSSTYTLNLQEVENFSQTLRGNFGYSYQSNYGPFISLPPNTNFSSTIAHQSPHTSQSYGFNRSAVGTQSSSDTISFSDTRQFNQALSNSVNFNLSSSQSNYGGTASANSTATLNTLTHLTTKIADYQMTIDKTFAAQPFGINKLPEFQIHPYQFFPHFVMPVSAQFTAGEYSEPANAFSSSRADLAFVLGPEVAKVFGSDFQGTVNLNQFAYSTGDLKASIQQNLSLTTPLGQHFANTLTYSESNYNGPAFVPFQYLDQQPTTNLKNAQDLLRIFNGDTYTASLGFSTNFDAIAQPVSYQLTARPSRRSILLLGGTFSPGSGNGFYSTNAQVAMPFGHDAQLQFVTDIDWKMKGRLENKVVYYTKTIGNCYQLQALYNQGQKLVTVSLNLLAFPSKSATFNVGQSGSLVPTNFNF
ncbi:MAG: hypothetical protein M3N13_08175, partial [Candidatus Eremiobacteraeota bacterium]|nr:hypothetical protein [Candidatus Eremiobacteraeota bacterium]